LFWYQIKIPSQLTESTSECVISDFEEANLAPQFVIGETFESYEELEAK